MLSEECNAAPPRLRLIQRFECAIFGGLSAFPGQWGNPSRSFNNAIVLISGCVRKTCIVVIDRQLCTAPFAGPTLVPSFRGPAKIASVVRLGPVRGSRFNY